MISLSNGHMVLCFEEMDIQSSKFSLHTTAFRHNRRQVVSEVKLPSSNPAVAILTLQFAKLDHNICHRGKGLFKCSVG